MQIKAALFCLATILVVSTSAGPVDLGDDDLASSNTVANTMARDPLKNINAEVLTGTLGKVTDKLKGGL
jgi:hypothetical protein